MHGGHNKTRRPSVEVTWTTSAQRTRRTLVPAVKRSFNKVDFAEFSHLVEQIDISRINPNSPGDLQKKWFESLHAEIMDDVAALRKFPMRRHSSLWLNAEIRQLMKQRYFVAKQFSKNPESSELQDDLKLLRKKIKSKIRHEAKEQGLKALASKNPGEPPGEPWNFINMATFTAKAGDDSLPPLSTLNEYFASVFQSTRPLALTVP